MPELADFQLAFAAALGRTSRRGRLERQPGFAVYRNTTATALIDALAANYPVVAEIVGGEDFERLASVYARLHPPSTPVLLAYGEQFPAFLDGQPWTSALPYLADVARIERLRTESHVAADAPALAARDVTRLGIEGLMRLRLPLHPATRFAWLRTPAMTIWQAHRDTPDFDRLEPEWQAEGALFTRPIARMQGSRIGAPEHQLLSGLRLGVTLGEACAAVADVFPEADIALLLTALVSRGAFAAPVQLERRP